MVGVCPPPGATVAGGFVTGGCVGGGWVGGGTVTGGGIASPGAMPANVLLSARAMVTAGLAKEVDDVNQ